MGTPIIDLQSGHDDDEPAQEVVRSGGPGWVVAAGAVAGLLLVGWWLSRPTEPIPVERPPSTTSTRPVETAAPAPEPVVAPATVGFDPPADQLPIDIVAASVGDETEFWRIDLASGTATRLAVAEDIDPTTIVEVRFFGADRAIALTDEGVHLDLAIDEQGVELRRAVDFGARTTFDLRSVDETGTSTWIGIPTGLINWDLTDDTIHERWIDNFGDRTLLPEIMATVEAGLVVEAGGRTFLIDDGEAVELDLPGQVIAGGANWLVVRSCDSVMRCGELSLHELTTGTMVTLKIDYRFRTECGLAIAGDDGSSLQVVLQRLGGLVLLTVATDGAMSEVDLHPVGIGCVDADDVGIGVVVAHDRALSLVGPTGVSELVQIEALRPITAIGASPSS